MDNFNFVQLQDLKLAGSGISLSDTSIVLQTMKLIDGVTNVTMSMFGALGMAVIEPDTSREENISFTGITLNPTDQTQTLTGVTRGLDFKTPYTAVAANRKAHAGGSIMRISNTAPFYDQIAVKNNDETVTGAWQFVNTEPNRPKLLLDTDATDAKSLVTLGQLSRTAAAGASDASTTVKGIVEIATSAEFEAGTANGGTGAVLVPPNSFFNGEGSLNIHTYVAGENINASTTPLAVYLKESDGRVYRTVAANLETNFGFIGFAIVGQNITTGNPIKIQTDGRVSGFTGLTAGGYYYTTGTAGVISTSPGTGTFQVGRADDTTTKLIIVKGTKVFSNCDSYIVAGTTTFTIGFKATQVKVYSSIVNTSSSWGGWNANTGNKCIFTRTPAAASSVGTSIAFAAIETAGNEYTGVISNVTSTSFDLVITKNGAPVNAAVVFVEATGA